jgi:hypothetical protein
MPAQCCKDRWARLLKEDDDMPVFTLLGKDKIALVAMDAWIAAAKVVGVNEDKMLRVLEHRNAIVQFQQKYPERCKIPD